LRSRYFIRFGFIPTLLVIVGSTVVSCAGQPPAGTMSALDVCTSSGDGALCDDDQPCTINDVCLNQRCMGTRVADGTPCTDGNVCTTGDVCTGAVCTGAPAPEGAVCTDGEPCTDPDVCHLGRCQAGPPKVCDDGNACTIDMCVMGTGCLFSPRDCVSPPDATSDQATSEVGGGGGDAIDSPAIGDAAGDAPGDSEASAGDGAVDGAGDGAVDGVVTPRDLHAHGGACNCAVGERPSPASCVVVGLAAAVVFVRRRRR
jgi:MYXO-CTERM domain-containing protein